MSLKLIFQNAADTVFTVFSSLIVPVEYISVLKDGFDEDVEDRYSVSMIIDSLSEKDVQLLTFNRLIQPMDVKGLIRGRELREKGISEFSTDDIVVDIENGTRYSVIAYTTDPAEALYIFLLRKVSGDP